MAERIRKLTNSEVEVLARIIADTMTGSQMNEIFQECGVQDVIMKVQNGREFITHF